MKIVMHIMFGPDHKVEAMDVGEDASVVIVRQCPFASEAARIGGSPLRAFKRYLAFNLSTQKILNPKYKSLYVRAICMGDRQCEIKVDRDIDVNEKT